MGKNMTLNITGGQINIANDNSTINAIQNNGTSGAKLEEIIKGMSENLHSLKKEDADAIIDIVELTKQAFSKPEPQISRLKNCLTLIAPMFTVANGLPTLYDNLQKLQEYIMQYIS